MTQERGLAGMMVGSMIRRSVGQCFRRVYWSPPPMFPEGPVVFACSHHGWHDGYLMFQAVKALNKPTLDWIAEFDAFPLFRMVGGLPFPPADPARRAATVRETWKLMRDEGWSLMVFGDGELKRSSEPWTVGSAVEAAVRTVPGVQIVPVAISYDMSVHQRPEAYLWFDAPITPEEGWERGSLCAQAKERIEVLLMESRRIFGQEHKWQPLQNCRLDVNERWDVRKSPLKKP
jgi:1-acyl-sn-glycerol-3-phosphate acyltransferase